MGRPPKPHDSEEDRFCQTLPRLALLEQSHVIQEGHNLVQIQIHVVYQLYSHQFILACAEAHLLRISELDLPVKVGKDVAELV
jgi:hypothetical protein